MTQQSPNSLIRICHHDHNNQIRNIYEQIYVVLSLLLLSNGYAIPEDFF